MPKVKKPEKSTKPVRHNPLAEQIIEEEKEAGLRRNPRSKARKSGQDGEDEEGVLPARVSRKLLEVAQAQREDADDGWRDDDTAVMAEGDEAADEEIEDVEVDEDGYVLAPTATEEEERALQLFMPGAAGKKAGPTLGDIILQKIQEAEAKKVVQGPAPTQPEAGLSPKAVEVYSEIGKWLKTYKSGKLPKAFKVVPSLTNWEEVLALTSPLTWSPAAMYEAVAIFASNLNPRMAQRFYNLVLLPAVRQDIAEHKRLNFHYFRALRKALFKPAAFFKGVLLPMATESCTLREALIVGSVLAKASIPPMHSAAALARLCQMSPWYGTTSIFIAALANKKYALPLRVIEVMTMHFCAFASEENVLPVVWHRALLVFIQRYKYELNDDQKRRLRELLKVHFHEAIGPEARRELLAPRPGVVAPGEGGAMDTS